MKITITGATGLLGKTATHHFAAAGHQVTAVDRVDGEVPEGVKLVIGDLTDLDFTDSVIAGADAVVHLGAIPSPRDERQYFVFRNNCDSTFAVFSAAVHAKVKVVAYASSQSIYGTAWSDDWYSPQYLPIDEQHPLVYQESYALTKEVNELSAQMFARRGKTAFVGFRFPLTHDIDRIQQYAEEFKSGSDERVKYLAKICFSYLDRRDAAKALELAATSDITGANVFVFSAPDSFSYMTTEETFKKWHPTTELRGDFSGYQSPFTSQKFIDRFGYKPQYLLDRSKM
jgi:nucleoside-diphosphate-sugar epimerase